MFDTYWRFAAARQQVYRARVDQVSPRGVSDPIIAAHRFTNCYRAADRVSQYLINNVIYLGDQRPQEVLFRTLLFKFFNRISTWELLREAVAQPTWAEFNFDAYDRVLTRAFAAGSRLYSAAYVIPPPQLGAVRKHTNHLLLLRHMLTGGLLDRLQDASSMAQAFSVLRGYPALGDFLAFQLVTDVNYSTVTDFDEMEFVVPGPGARDGLRKCFGDAARGVEAELIRYMCDSQDEHFARLGLQFPRLNGQRRLQLVDCQNLFCEVDKYARVAHPGAAGYSGRTRIKQRYTSTDLRPVTAWFPPKWGINAHDAARDGVVEDGVDVGVAMRGTDAGDPRWAPI